MVTLFREPQADHQVKRVFRKDTLFFVVRPARTYSNGCKSPTRPNSGKRPANDKGVHGPRPDSGSKQIGRAHV